MRFIQLTLATSGQPIHLRVDHVLAVMPAAEWGTPVPKDARAAVLITGSLAYCVREEVEVAAELVTRPDARHLGDQQ